MPEPPNTVVYGPWKRGVNYSKPADELGIDELFAMQNGRIGNVGQFEKRPGSTPLNTTALNAGATVTACGSQVFSASSASTFAIVGNKFYESIGGTPADRTGTNIITAGDDKTWELVNAKNLGILFGHNGVVGDTLLKWSAAGANIAALGVSARFTWAKHFEYWDQRGWAANASSGTNRVWYSNSDDVETWGALAFFTFDEDITGIHRGPGGLIVHTQHSIYILSPTGDSTTPYRKLPINQSEDFMGGSESGRAIVNVPDVGQVFPRRDGIYALSPQQRLVKISAKLDGARYWDNINPDRLAYSFAQIYPLLGWVVLWLPYGATQTKMNHAMIFDYRMSEIMGEYIWQGPDTVLTRNCASLIGGKPHFGGFDGFLYKHETGNADNDGTTNLAIDGYYDTGQTPPAGWNDDCRWKKVRTFFEVKGTYVVDIQEQSPDTPTRTQTLVMGGAYDGIGTTFAIGVSKIAGDNLVTYGDLDLLGSSPFKAIRTRNSNANEAFTIRRNVLEFELVGAVRRDNSGIT